jgi:hypothetical protein
MWILGLERSGYRYVYIDPLAKYRGDDELLKKRLKLDYQRSDA